MKTFSEFVAEAVDRALRNEETLDEEHDRVEHTSRKAFEKQAKEQGYSVRASGKHAYHHIRAVEDGPGLSVHIRGEFKPDRAGGKIKDSGQGHLHIKKKQQVTESREQHREEAKKYLAKAGEHDEGTFEHHDYMAKHHMHQSKVAIRSDEHVEKAKAHRAKADRLA